jgi:Methane oxygenase PmoA
MNTRWAPWFERKIVAAKSGAEQGELEVETDWVTADQKVLLKEHTLLVFRGGPKFRSIDRVTTLQAQQERVVFEDDKEGLMGMRVTRALEMTSDKAETFLDASGRPTTVPRVDNAGVNGTYLTNEGKTGDAAWGTRGRWCNLSGSVEGQPVTITIFDNPANPNFPAYWHAVDTGCSP